MTTATEPSSRATLYQLLLDLGMAGKPFKASAMRRNSEFVLRYVTGGKLGYDVCAFEPEARAALDGMNERVPADLCESLKRVVGAALLREANRWAKGR